MIPGVGHHSSCSIPACTNAAAALAANAAGNSQPLGEFFKDVWPELCQYAYTIVGPNHAEDMVQNVFMRFGKWDCARCCVMPWLKRCVRNECLDLLRRSYIKNEIAVSPEDFERIENGDCAWLLDFETLRRALHKLPPLHFRAVRLRYFEGKSLQAIAEIFRADGIPRPVTSQGVGNLIAAAIAMLRDQLGVAPVL